MLTQKDFDELEQLIEEKLDEKFKYYPTKNDFYNKMDELMAELKAIREEQTLITRKIGEHTDLLENHETRIKKSRTSSYSLILSRSTSQEKLIISKSSSTQTDFYPKKKGFILSLNSSC